MFANLKMSGLLAATLLGLASLTACGPSEQEKACQQAEELLAEIRTQFLDNNKDQGFTTEELDAVLEDGQYAPEEYNEVKLLITENCQD